jgi:glycosyltransferase involved in cell wall biosynthesis
MRVVIAHNCYQQAGGEDQCVSAEIAMLKSHGHEVTEYFISNDLINKMGRLDVATRTLWSRPAFGQLRKIFRSVQPEIVHFHNTFPLISPAGYYAARAEGVRVVQTLHNFRLCCANALFFRDGVVCESCLQKVIPWPGVIHRCYRNSRLASAAVAGMLGMHRALGTWWKAVDVYIALSEFSRRKLAESGLPSERIAVKPNFAHPDPGLGEGCGGYAIFVGRLSTEKGLDVALRAWSKIGNILPLKIVGDGPLAPEVRAAAERNPSIQYLGKLPLASVYNLIGDATALLLPSRCYENFPRVIVEAFAKGTPVIVSNLGAMAEIVEDARNGLHFRVGDPGDLASKVWQILADPVERARMRRAAREDFQNRYTAAANYSALISIYDRAVSGHRQRAKK